jgi:hypothetical protein
MPDETVGLAGPAPDVTFVVARGQNAFFVELVDVLHRELVATGVRTSIAVGGFPEPSAGRVYVVLPPHEYASLEGRGPLDDPAILQRTIIVGAEQPESQWFPLNLEWATEVGAVFDINRRGVDAYRDHGIDATLLPLGYTSVWDTRLRSADGSWDDGRDIDVLFLGARSERRDRVLAQCAGVLARHDCHLVISDNDRPNVGTSASFVAGDDKRSLLRRARVLLNVHRDDEPYFEWLRVVEAVHAGAVVVTERSTGMAPFLAGDDVLVSSAASLPWVLEHALADDARLGAMRRHALDTLRERPMGVAAGMLARAAAALTSEPVPAAAPPARSVPLARTQSLSLSPAEEQPGDDAGQARSLNELRLDVQDLSQRLAQTTIDLRGDASPAVEIVQTTAAYGAAPTPEVTVAVAVGRGARHQDVCATLASIARSTDVMYEVVVVSNLYTESVTESVSGVTHHPRSGSTESVTESALGVARWMGQHERVPVILARRHVPRGIAACRNTAVDLARGRFVLVLDAGAQASPDGLGVLLDEFDEPDVAFAYGLLEGLDVDGPAQLLSTMAWDPSLPPKTSALVEATMMVRTRALRAVGGFTTDPHLLGWEHYELMCALAERGDRGRFVPSLVGRYRMTSSLRTVPEVERRLAFDRLRERHPRLMARPSVHA